MQHDTFSTSPWQRPSLSRGLFLLFVFCSTLRLSNCTLTKSRRKTNTPPLFWSVNFKQETCLKLLQLLLCHSVQDSRGVGQGCGSLRGLEPFFKPGEVVQELLPQPPRLFNPSTPDKQSVASRPSRRWPFLTEILQGPGRFRSVRGGGGGTDLSLLSMDMAQMFLQRLSSPLVACWMESHSVSVEQASQSCRRTSHRFSTDATPVLCFSMSL